MRKASIWAIDTVIFLAACASPHLPTPVTPESIPSSQLQIKPTEISTKSWRFNFQNQLHTYTSITQSTFQSNSDSFPASDTLFTTLHFSILARRFQTLDSITGHIDHAQLTTGTRIHTEQQFLKRSLEFTGISTSSRLTLSLLSAESNQSPCDSLTYSYLGELHSGIFFLPQHLQTTTTWTDTLSTIQCSGSKLPSNVESIRTYQVQGEDINTHLLLITRTEAINVTGTGSQGEHRVNLSAQGTGASKIFLDPQTGTVHLIEANQRFSIVIFTSGQIHHFTQETKQTLNLIN